MKRTLSVCAVLLLLPLAGRAADPNDIVIRMTVRPMPAPKPALKYQLLPELREMNPGNPIHEYTRCFAEQQNFWHTKDSVENREKWQTMPLKELPLKELRRWGYARGNPLRYAGPLGRADYAARLDTPDWQMLLPLKNEGFRLLLPDVQQLRELASALKVRFRYEIAEHRFSDALVTAKTTFALSRHMGEHPSLIGDLVAIAIGSLTIGPLDEMIQEPGCPNLFWALTALPSPFIDLRKGLQADRLMLAKETALIDDRAPMTEAALQKVIEHFASLVRASGGDDRLALSEASKWLKAQVQDAEGIRAARKRLTESGLAADVVEKFPALQIVLLDKKREVEAWHDDMIKAMSLPYWQARPVLDAAPRLNKEVEKLLPWVLINHRKVKLAQTRLDQRLGLLRCVEALRLYAAGHDGRLPAALADIGLPLPVDPATGKPFSYKLDGATAHLQGAPLVFQVRYEVTIAR